MFDDIKDKAVLITGASSGIGAAIARGFAKQGAKVGIHFRSRQKDAEKVLKEVRGYSGEGELFQEDFTHTTVKSSLIRDFVNTFGRIDVLVNNAGGIYDYVHFTKLDIASWDKTFALNVRAPFLLIRQVFEHMQARNGGRIINITTNSSKYGGSAENLHYVAAKAALDTMTVGLAREGAPHNILINSIRCGVIETPMRNRITGYSDERYDQRIQMIPLQRAGRPENIADMVLFLASSSGDFITGQVLAVSGGE